MRILAVAFALVLGGSAHAASTAFPYTITTTAPPSACPDDDGSAQASAGAPNMPGALALGLSGQPYKASPHDLGCKIAGVDYRVGVAQGAVLKTPSGNLPAGCSMSGSFVTCAQDGLVFSGFDMGGMQLEVSGRDVTIRGNRWKLDAKCLVPIMYVPVGTWHIDHNSIDGSGDTLCPARPITAKSEGLAGGFPALVYNGGDSGAGAVDYVQFNEFLNTPEDTLNFSGSTGGAAPMTPHIDFNFWKGQGWIGHPDGIQLTGGKFANITVLHDTYVNTRQNADPGIQPLHLEAQLTSSVTGAVTAFNTVIMPGTCKGGNNWPNPGDPPPYHCVGNFAFACKNDTGTRGETDSFTGYRLFGNYTDASGAIAVWTDDACTGSVAGVPLPNVDMVTGKATP